VIIVANTFFPICGNETVTPDSDPGSILRFAGLDSGSCPGRLSGAGRNDVREARRAVLPGFSISSFQMDIIVGNYSNRGITGKKFRKLTTLRSPGYNFRSTRKREN
jgi:hypothetical protein